MNLPLYDDVICSTEWVKLADYLYSTLPDGHDPWETEALEVTPTLRKYSSREQLGKTGVVFVNGHNHLIHCFQSLHPDGAYIVISRDRDNTITEAVLPYVPPSLKRVYAVNCAVRHPVFVAIPVGQHTSGRPNDTLQRVAIEEHDRRPGVLVRFTMAPPSRVAVWNRLESNPFCTVLPPGDAYETKQLMREHTFVACPNGFGADCLRIWEAITLGAIPIVDDCPELTQFADFPILFTKDWNLTEEWCVEQASRMGTSTERLHMEYWREQVRIARTELLVLPSPPPPPPQSKPTGFGYRDGRFRRV